MMPQKMFETHFKAAKNFLGLMKGGLTDEHMEYLSNPDKFDFIPKEVVPELNVNSVIEQSETASESLLPDDHSKIPEMVKHEICDYCGDCVLRKMPENPSGAFWTL